MAPKRIRKVRIRIPAEWEPHACCWMAWAVHREWGARDAARIKRDLTKVVHAIAGFEPIRLLAPRGREFREARKQFSDCRAVTVVEAPVDDIWMRDIMPTFAVRTDGAQRQVVAIDWNFNAWGGSPDRPFRVGDRLAKTAAAVFGVPRLPAPFIGEGGALVFDGRGTLITTRSCLLNSNRNPVRKGVDRQEAITSGLRKFGIRKVIWLEGDPAEPITSGHVDGYVLPAPGNTILVESVDDPNLEAPFWREHDIALLRDLRNADGRKLRILRVGGPRLRYWKSKSDNFAPCYLNAYVANGAVVGTKFGDTDRDEAARKALVASFPGRKIMMLRIDAIADGGGGVHCVTQPMPAS